MDNQDTAPPAGDGAQPVDHTLDGVLARRQERREKEAEQPKADENQPEGDAEQHQPGEEPEPTADEADAPGAEEAPELEAGDPEPEYAHGNLKVRFRDGSEATVGDLKKGREELQELRRQVPDVLAARQEVEQVKARLAQQQQQFEEVLPYALQAIQSAIPPEPTDEFWESDPFEAGRQQHLRDKAIRQRDGLSAAAQQAEYERQAAYLREQQSEMLKAHPELRDPEAVTAFERDYHAVAKALGFTQAEADRTHDHRLVGGMVGLWRKAQKWDALQAAKTKVAAKTQSAAPVAIPGRRPAPGEQGSVQVKLAEQQARKSGSIDDVLALRTARSSVKQR